MRRLFLAGLLAAAPVPGSAQVFPPDVMKKDIIGCADWDTYERMNRTVLAGDREAFAKIVVPALARENCRRFKKGDSVRLEDTAILSGASCVRPAGATHCYWIPIDASVRP